MADVKISQLPVETSLAESAVLPIVQGGVTYQAALSTVGNTILNGSTNISTTGSISGGNINGGNIQTTGQILATGSISTPLGTVSANQVDANSVTVVNNISVGGNVIGSYVNGFNGINSACVQIGQSTISAFGNITGSYIFGNGAYLTGISGGTGSTGNWTFADNTVSMPLNANATISTSATGNITGTFTFENDGTFITDTLLAGNVYVDDNIITVLPSSSSYGDLDRPLVVNGNVSVTGNISSGNLSVTNSIASGNVSVTGNISVGNILTDNYFYANGTPFSGGGSSSATWPVTNTAGSSGPANIAIGGYAGFNNQGTQAIAIGQNSGSSDQGSYSVAIGPLAGGQSQGTNSVAIGPNAGLQSQGQLSVAIGSSAGQQYQSSQAVAIGNNAGGSNQGQYGIALGYYTGNYNQGAQSIAIGIQAGACNQGDNAVAIGQHAGSSQINQGQNAVSIGINTGKTTQGQSAVAIGEGAGNNNQAPFGIAIGQSAGGNTQGQSAVAIGRGAGTNNQGNCSVSIGYYTAQLNQGTNSVAIGGYAAPQSQGNYSVAIGYFAGGNSQGANSIAIGTYSGGNFSVGQGNNSIVLNATGSIINPVGDNTFVVAPIRSATGAISLLYDPTTKEVTYAATGGGGSTGNWTFSANTVTLPNQDTAVFNTRIRRMICQVMHMLPQQLSVMLLLFHSVDLLRV
jgi:hypothetical protein